MLEIAATAPKLKVNLRFISGPMRGKVISIDPTKGVTVFGCLNQRPSGEILEMMTGMPEHDVDYVYLLGARVSSNHMQIFFDPLCCSLLL